MPKRDRSPTCPGRLYGSRLGQLAGPTSPGRPPRCPCLWTEFIINRNFIAIMQNDPDLGYRVVRLLRLFGE